MDKFFQIRNLSVPLPGLDRAYTILHFTDLHICERDAQSSREDAEASARCNRHWEQLRYSFAAEFGDSTAPEHCISLKGYMDRFVNLANELSPDAVVITGDAMDIYTDSNVRYLERTAAKIHAPTALLRGNHERGDHPEYRRLYGDHPDFRILNVGALKLLLIDDSAKKVSAETLAEVQKAASGNGTAILCSHIPFYTPSSAAYWDTLEPYYTVNPADSDCDDDTRAFVSYIASPDCPVMLHLCGHIHGFSRTELSPGRLQLTATSAMFGGCTLLTLTPEN